MKWRELNLSKADGRPEVRRLCVIRRRVKGFGDSAIAMQNPARWKDHYTDMEWTEMDEEVRA